MVHVSGDASSTWFMSVAMHRAHGSRNGDASCMGGESVCMLLGYTSRTGNEVCLPRHAAVVCGGQRACIYYTGTVGGKVANNRVIRGLGSFATLKKGRPVHCKL